MKMRESRLEWGGGCHSCGELQTSICLMRGIQRKPLAAERSSVLVQTKIDNKRIK